MLINSKLISMKLEGNHQCLSDVKEVLDEAFHNEGDAYPRGCPEHKELQVWRQKVRSLPSTTHVPLHGFANLTCDLQEFVPKVASLKHARAAAAALKRQQAEDDEAQKQVRASQLDVLNDAVSTPL